MSTNFVRFFFFFFGLYSQDIAHQWTSDDTNREIQRIFDYWCQYAPTSDAIGKLNK